MSKVKQQNRQVLLTDGRIENIFNNIFLHNEDSWHEIQDQVLNIIKMKSRIS